MKLYIFLFKDIGLEEGNCILFLSNDLEGFSKIRDLIEIMHTVNKKKLFTRLNLVHNTDLFLGV